MVDKNETKQDKKKLLPFKNALDNSQKVHNIYLSHRIIDPEGPKARTKKTGIDFMIRILIFVENWL